MNNRYLEKIASWSNMFSRYNPNAEKTILGNVKSMIGAALGPRNFKGV